ncbi:hypothetical protein OG21DRAFT_1170848 [Imleria badia]|nr:hypothetical protein OG21DRAFT_1170848 [Imleria badia]
MRYMLRLSCKSLPTVCVKLYITDHALAGVQVAALSGKPKSKHQLIMTHRPTITYCHLHSYHLGGRDRLRCTCERVRRSALTIVSHYDGQGAV